MSQLVVFNVEWLYIMPCTCNLSFDILYWMIQNTATDKVNQTIFVHAWLIIGKKFWMFSDKAYYIEVLDYRWFEATKSIGRDYKFITWNLAAVAVQTYIRRITQAITFVERVACVYQQT